MSIYTQEILPQEKEKEVETIKEERKKENYKYKPFGPPTRL